MIEFAMALVLSAAGAAPPPDKISFTEKVLTVIPDDVNFRHLAISPTGQHSVYVAIKNGQYHVVVDKIFGPPYESIPGKAYFLGDGRTIVYQATVGGDSRLIVNGKPALAASVVGEPVFSPDYKRFAFVGKNRGSGNAAAKAYFVVVNGRKGPLYEGCGNPAFSADGSTVAYSVKMPPGGGRNFGLMAMTVNGRIASPMYLRVYDPIFAPKGRGMAYRVTTGGITSGMTAMVVNGRPHKEKYPEIGPPHWSPDGKRLAYTATADRIKNFMVVDGKPEEPWDYLGQPVWNRTGTSYAYRVQKGLEHRIVVNGKAGKSYVGVSRPSFTADGKTVAHGARVKLKWSMVVGDKQGNADLGAIYGPPVFSPDGKHVAFPAGWKYKWIMSVDGIKGELYDYTSNPVWSPVGNKLAYAARRLGKNYMVVHYRRLEPFDKILTPPYWSKDGTKVAFGVLKGREVHWRVILLAE